MTDALAPTGGGLNETDFLALFAQELTWQDPLKPVDNREFMAQMAQFSNLQEARNQSELLGDIKRLAEAQKSLALLGKTVPIPNNPAAIAMVRGVLFSESREPQIRIQAANAMPMDIPLGDITGAGL